MLEGTELGWAGAEYPVARQCASNPRRVRKGKISWGNRPVHVAPEVNQCRKGFIQLALSATSRGLGAKRGQPAVPGRLVTLTASTCTQGEALVAVAVEGTVAVVADMVTGARLYLALIYVWKRRGEDQTCAKGTGFIWHRQGRGWKRAREHPETG